MGTDSRIIAVLHSDIFSNKENDWKYNDSLGVGKKIDTIVCEM